MPVVLQAVAIIEGTEYMEIRKWGAVAAAREIEMAARAKFWGAADLEAPLIFHSRVYDRSIGTSSGLQTTGWNMRRLGISK